MGIVGDKIKELKDREAKTLQMGGEKAVAKQREKGKLTARERLDLLFDKETFREIDMFVTHRCVNFGMEKVEIPSDGVVTGHGLVEGRPVFAFSQDFTARAGSLGEMHAKKICPYPEIASTPSCILAPPESLKPIQGTPALSARSITLQIFFACISPRLPALAVKS